MGLFDYIGRKIRESKAQRDYGKRIIEESFYREHKEQQRTKRKPFVSMPSTPLPNYINPFPVKRNQGKQWLLSPNTNSTKRVWRDQSQSRNDRVQKQNSVRNSAGDSVREPQNEPQQNEYFPCEHCGTPVLEQFLDFHLQNCQAAQQVLNQQTPYPQGLPVVPNPMEGNPNYDNFNRTREYWQYNPNTIDRHCPQSDPQYWIPLDTSRDLGPNYMPFYDNNDPNGSQNIPGWGNDYN